ncbi:MAG: hypothetical protein ACYTHK_00865 [Planctomycetota bacterium]|jgi:hypothetical protein
MAVPKLELVRESKLYKLIPGKKKNSRLEASGVALVDDHRAAVIFDSLNLIALVDLSLKKSKQNRLCPAPSIGEGFEDIALDEKERRIYCIIESMEDSDGQYRGFVTEYDDQFRLQRCARLATAFTSPNKGFEGLAFLRRGGRQLLYAMCEGNLCTDAKSGGGRIQAFSRTRDGAWRWSHEVKLPMTAEFEDYAGLSYRRGRLAVISQASARLWIGKVDEKARTMDDGVVYRFPKKSYGNVEGVAWIDDETLVMVSDKKKARQPEKCAERDQSIHIFRLPA